VLLNIIADRTGNEHSARLKSRIRKHEKHDTTHRSRKAICFASHLRLKNIFREMSDERHNSGKLN